jgi:Membrane domain of glycerophosphoryl diester phosphodiesterase
VGEKLRLAGLWRLGRGRIWALVGWVLIVTGIVIVVLAILVGILVAIVATGGQAGIVAGVLLGIVLFLGLVAAGFWLGTKLALVPSAIMLERMRIGAAVRRSWSLTEGFFWRTLGIQLLVSVILNVASQVITTPFSLLFTFLPVIFAPTGDPTPSIVLAGLSYVLLLMVTAVVAAVASVVQSATSALLYIDLRMRKEGLDLRLQRFVEERAAGNPAAADPYLLAGAAAATPAQGASSPGTPPAGSHGGDTAWA